MALAMAMTLMIQEFAFRKTFQRQYRKAASHRNHSNIAASMTVPMTATYTILASGQLQPIEFVVILPRCHSRL